MEFFFTKTMVNAFGKISIFWTFWLSCFYGVENRFFVLEYHKTHFSNLYCLKKKSGKNGHFWTKTMGQLLWKYLNFSNFWTFCIFSLERRFLVLEYCQAHFSGLYCLKIKVEKMAFFRLKPWVNPFRKISIFRLFELLAFIA